MIAAIVAVIQISAVEHDYRALSQTLAVVGVKARTAVEFRVGAGFKLRPLRKMRETVENIRRAGGETAVVDVARRRKRTLKLLFDAAPGETALGAVSACRKSHRTAHIGRTESVPSGNRKLVRTCGQTAAVCGIVALERDCGRGKDFQRWHTDHIRRMPERPAEYRRCGTERPLLGTPDI